MKKNLNIMLRSSAERSLDFVVSLWNKSITWLETVYGLDENSWRIAMPDRLISAEIGQTDRHKTLYVPTGKRADSNSAETE
ncbi:hypothetical protein NPIL_599721 [Nephila pilipes]|uniref:Uncharacterized protein n=1 Tax=Nephila pilipes TaxID=299642 RepID=A0A8X6QZ78_NEPPI|nr:hypothetical protein NPIL_599721 [Nephila pilipes]